MQYVELHSSIEVFSPSHPPKTDSIALLCSACRVCVGWGGGGGGGGGGGTGVMNAQGV